MTDRYFRPRSATRALLVWAALAGPLVWPFAAAHAQTTPEIAAKTAGDGVYTVNLRGVDLQVFAEQVATITGRTLVLDPNVTAPVTVLSSKPLDKDGVWDLFQSVLGLNGLTAVQSGDLWRVVALGAARGAGGIGAGTPAVAEGRLDVVTRLVRLETFPAATAVEALRPLVSEFGYLEAVPGTNTLIVTDAAENVEKVQAIARDLDTDGQDEVFTLRIRQANAAEIGAALQAVLSAEGGPRITVDARANTIVVKGNAETRRIVEAIVTDLDIPAQRENASVPVVRVYRLQNADAETLAGVLRGVLGQGEAATNPVAESLSDVPLDLTEAAPSDFAAALSSGMADESVTVQAVVETNAVLVRARPDVHRQITDLIATLDQRRPQVLIEAAIVEVSGEIAEQLGVQLGLGAAVPPGGFAATSLSPSGPTLSSILTLLGVPESAAIAKGGLSAGIGSDDFGLLLQALGQSNKARLLSTPSITTLDNQPAEIIVGQNVPFRTGAFASGETGEDTFTTIERQDVGITMRVVPRVNDGDVVQLEVRQEVSALTDTAVEGAADLVTNRRSISTTVLADNGGTIVLGGLITNDSQTSGSQVPGISRVPILGELFKSRIERRKKQTLFVFLRPTILRDRIQSGAVADDRYQRLQSIDLSAEPDSPLFETRPVRRLPIDINGVY